jgi:hypothetical protein
MLMKIGCIWAHVFYQSSQTQPSNTNSTRDSTTSDDASPVDDSSSVGMKSQSSLDSSKDANEGVNVSE